MAAVQRGTANPLLVKDVVGHTKPTCYDLPAATHVYGKKVERDPKECAATVLQQWHVKANSKNVTPALDYISMNRNTTKKKITTPKEIREYRRANPVRVKVGDHSRNAINGENGGDGAETTADWLKRRCRAPLPSDADPYFTYGKPTRPSTPVGKLMSDDYQREWVQEQERRSIERAKAEKKKLAKAVTTKKTVKAAPLPIEKDVKTLFKMSKFRSKDAKISCWRDGSDPAIAPILEQQKKIHGVSRGLPTTSGPSAANTNNRSPPKKSENKEGIPKLAAPAAEPGEVAGKHKASKGVSFADN
ncbi:hypothetical protein BJ742DRAFT_786565 [Cladochytrium replicatum]|nr:hypothetical protein BJ742DRAFT_786565 [Cladochytrium replicatum]